MHSKPIAFQLLILTVFLLGACVPTSIPVTVPTITVPTFTAPTVNPPSFGITLAPSGGNAPAGATPAPGGLSTDSLGNAATLIFYGLLALIGVILIIAMFAYFFRRKPDE